jgi:hypothetical protein
MNTSANIEAVRKLCERWAWLSEKEFAELLAQDCIYYDVPFPRAQAVGPQAAHAKLRLYTTSDMLHDRLGWR